MILNEPADKEDLPNRDSIDESARALVAIARQDGTVTKKFSGFVEEPLNGTALYDSAVAVFKQYRAGLI